MRAIAEPKGLLGTTSSPRPRLVDAGIITTTARQDLGTINAANLREAHRIQQSGTAIGKTTLTGF